MNTILIYQQLGWGEVAHAERHHTWSNDIVIDDKSGLGLDISVSYYKMVHKITDGHHLSGDSLGGR